MRRTRLAAIVVISGLALSGCTVTLPPAALTAELSLGELAAESPEYLEPFAFFTEEGMLDDAEFDELLQRGHPLQTTSALMAHWLSGFDEALLQDRLRMVISSWELDQPGATFSYRFDYREFSAGWHSGMADWAFPVLLLGVSQSMGTDEFGVIAESMWSTASLPVPDGGSIWRTPDGCWVSEYADDHMTIDDEYFVMNGHLYAMLAIRLLALNTDDAELDELYECTKRGTRTWAPEFEQEGLWYWYMLYPPTINQTHYLLFEVMLLAALEGLDADSFLSAERSGRQEALAHHFPVYGTTDAVGASELVFSAITAPHPYSIDIYPMTFECTDGASSELLRLDDPPAEEGEYIDESFFKVPTELDLDSARCSVVTFRNGSPIEMFTKDVTPIADASPRSPIPVEHRLEPGLNARQVGASSFMVTEPGPGGEPPSEGGSKNSRIGIDLDQPIALSPHTQIGIRLSNTRDVSLGVNIYEGEDSYFRYYHPVPAGDDNLVLLSHIGFNDGYKMSRIDEMLLTAYPSDTVDANRITIEEVFVVENALQLRNYFAHTEPTFSTK